MVDDAKYFLAKIETATGKDKLKYLRQLHSLVEAETIIQQIKNT